MSTEPWAQLELETGSSRVDPSKLVLVGIEGEAEIARPYRYTLTFEYHEDGGLPWEALDDMLRQPCTARWGPHAETVLTGRLESIATDSIDDPTRITYRAELVPRLALLRHTVRSRVFQDVDPAAIARSILTEHHLREGDDFELRLSETYPTAEYVVQYQESDLDFLSRQLEHHGIHYHFAQQPDRERLVIADANRGLSRYVTPRVAYRPRDTIGVGEEAVHTLSRQVHKGARAVLLTDFNWRTPQVQLSNLAPADEASDVGLTQRHGEHYKTPSEGAAIARVRAEQIVSERVRYRGEATLYELTAGQHFELEGHPLGEYDREYVVVRAALAIQRGNETSHRQTLELAEHAVPYRAPLRTPKPRILGFIHGRIDAPAHSTAAPIDEHGRYKVLLPFDLNGRPGGKASRWIRVAQPASGPGYGVHLPMHLGAEVAISHLDGDPDRPVILGSTHNADTPNPVVAENATQSWIKTQAGVRVLLDDDVQ